MRTIKHRIKNILAVALFCFAGNISAQVTIGSIETPAAGAILDVRNQAADANNVTSTVGGIVMPRVRLENINTLEPIIANDDPELADMNRWHIGLLVYNLNNNEPFAEGLYVWNGTHWEAVLSDTNANETGIAVENGLTFANGYIELGGTLNSTTVINQNNNNMQFTTGGGAFSVNSSSFSVQNGNVGIGREAPEQQLDIAGNARINGNLTVQGKTVMQGVEIIGTANAPAYLQYRPAGNVGQRITGRFLFTNSHSGRAFWSSIGGLEAVNMEPLPVSDASVFRFNPTHPESQTNFLDTRMAVELPPGRWLIKYSVRMVTTVLNAASTSAVIPSMFRFTLLENGVPIPSGNGIAKPYNDSIAFPDTFYNSLNGFFIVTNSSEEDKIYTLGIKTRQLSPTWVNGDVEIINSHTNDAFIIPIFMSFD